MNSLARTRGTAALIVGDLITFLFSLVLTLAVRYGEIPGRGLLLSHLPAFSVLIAIFLLVNFSAGLYEKQYAIIRRRILGLLLRVQLVNAVIGIIFFYFAPVAVAPKANLFIYFILSTALLLLWRSIMFPVFSIARKQPAILVGKGEDIEDLYNEVNGNMRYSLLFKDRISSDSPAEEIVSKIKESLKNNGFSVIVADLLDPAVEQAIPKLYSLIFSGVQILDAAKLYEVVFDRIPLSLLREKWLIENSSAALGQRRFYDNLKRAVDIAVSFLGGIVSLVFYPFVILAIKIEDKGPIFISQERTGKNGRPVRIVKFRSMSGNDGGNYGKDGATKFTVTKVGNFIRKSRIDEVPQFWNVLRGDLSLVGPRPELPHLSSIYEKEIPYYNARLLVKPGLFGWAQIYHQAHPHHAVATEDTKDKLSYDLYYLKNRSFTLDLKIILRTLQVLMKRAGK